MTTTPLRRREDYDHKTVFNVKDFLASWNNDVVNGRPLSCDILTDMHSVFQTVEIGGVRQLDIGCGPSIVALLSSSRQCSQIIMAEYAEQNRKEVIKWLKGDPEAHDWKPVMEYVANMEDNTTLEEIEKRVRSSILEVVPCDILQDNPIPSNPEFLGSFDLVTSCLCVEAACLDLNSHADAHKNISRFLKKGGMLVLAGILGSSWYTVGKETFFELSVNKENIDDSLAQAGYGPATWYIHQSDSAKPDTGNYKINSQPSGWFVLYTKKM